MMKRWFYFSIIIPIRGFIHGLSKFIENLMMRLRMKLHILFVPARLLILSVVTKKINDNRHDFRRSRRK